MRRKAGVSTGLAFRDGHAKVRFRLAAARGSSSHGSPMSALLDVLLRSRPYHRVVIATAIMSWLIAFDVVNTRNDVVRAIWNGLLAITEPVLRPIRNLRCPRWAG